MSNRPGASAPVSTAIECNAMTAEALQVSATMLQLTGAALAPQVLGPSTFVVVPDGWKHIDLTAAIEKAQPMRERKQGTADLKDLQSLLAYCADQAAADRGYIYADPDARTITAVFNDQRADVAGWRDHRAAFKAEYTPEFTRWLQNDGSSHAKSQVDFAEFVEDNLADITEPAAQQLLDVATTIQASSGINFSSAKRLQDGQVQLTYNETIEARAGSNGELKIPKEFALGLRIFKNGEGYKLKARLKYRLGSGTVKFWYELDRPERAVEDAFAGYIEQVRQSGYVVLVGRAG